MMRNKTMLVAVLSAVLFVGFTQSGRAATEHHLTKKELKALIANAKTPEDHEKIAAYYRSEAKRLRADAIEHKEWAHIYANGGASKAQQQAMTNGAPAAPHCEKWAELENQEADEADALAAQHEEMAKAAAH